MKGKDMKCRIEGCPNEVWPVWNSLCRECAQDMIDWQPSDEDNGEPVNDEEDYEEREEAHGK